jgi:hypothetical protein
VEEAHVVLAIGPTGVYLILAVLFLIILGGGTFLAYRMNQAKSSAQSKHDGGSSPQG